MAVEKENVELECFVRHIYINKIQLGYFNLKSDKTEEGLIDVLYDALLPYVEVLPYKPVKFNLHEECLDCDYWPHRTYVEDGEWCTHCTVCDDVEWPCAEAGLMDRRAIRDMRLRIKDLEEKEDKNCYERLELKKLNASFDISWPLNLLPMEIPQGDHPGAFGSVRKFDVHTGIDLYCPEGTEIVAMEFGVVVAIEVFTGPNTNPPSPWWNETFAVLVEGPSGVILYGEMLPCVLKGDVVTRGQVIGNVKTVLKKDKGEPMTMLHLEHYAYGVREGVWWKLGEDKPDTLYDPYPLLQKAQKV